MLANEKLLKLKRITGNAINVADSVAEIDERISKVFGINFNFLSITGAS